MAERFFIGFDDEITKTQCLEVKARLEKHLDFDVIVNEDYDRLMISTNIGETANYIQYKLDSFDWPNDRYITVEYPDGSYSEIFPE
jgi:hypothetical protein